MAAGETPLARGTTGGDQRPVRPQASKTALDAMMPYLTEKYGNPSSLYSFAQEAKTALEESRKTIAGIPRRRRSQ
jgi:cysteine sulfinate desulfinase/cysteine desulfurase-like protein